MLLDHCEMDDWVVMAAWLLLRSRLLLPPDSPAQRAAEREASALQARLVALHDMQSCVGWLACQPQLGIDVFARQDIREKNCSAAETMRPVRVGQLPLSGQVHCAEVRSRIHRPD
jgi:chromatin segregation and condensation protein Rec8/ScpA/Scc1 (kleisin family)